MVNSISHYHMARESSSIGAPTPLPNTKTKTESLSNNDDNGYSASHSDKNIEGTLTVFTMIVTRTARVVVISTPIYTRITQFLEEWTQSQPEYRHVQDNNDRARITVRVSATATPSPLLHELETKHPIPNSQDVQAEDPSKIIHDSRLSNHMQRHLAAHQAALLQANIISNPEFLRQHLDSHAQAMLQYQALPQTNSKNENTDEIIGLPAPPASLETPSQSELFHDIPSSYSQVGVDDNGKAWTHDTVTSHSVWSREETQVWSWTSDDSQQNIESGVGIDVGVRMLDRGGGLVHIDL